MQYVLQFTAPTNNAPADSVTVHWAFISQPSAVYDSHKIPVPVAGIIRRVDVKVSVGLVLGSAEPVSFSVRLNDATDVGAVSMGLTAVHNHGAATGLAIPVVAGDFLAMKMVTPAWATNPTNVRYYASVVIETT